LFPDVSANENEKGKTKMKTILALLILLNGNLFAGNAGGNGGDPYLDELKAYRSWLIGTLERNETHYKGRFEYDDEEFKRAIRTIREIVFVRKDMLDLKVKIEGKDEKAKVSEILPAPIDEMFVIGGERKPAVNYVLQGTPFIFVDPAEWEKLDGKISRKRAHFAHEVYGVLGLEKTGDIHLSKQFIDDKPDSTVVTKDGSPVTPLWTERFYDTFLIDAKDTCEAAADRRLPKIIGGLCKPNVPGGEPSPFFSYECAFAGSIQTHWHEGTTTTQHTVRARVPGVYTAYRSSSFDSYFFADSEIVKKIVRSRSDEYETHRPGYDIFKTTTIEVPHYQKYCRVKGSVFLSGIDPLVDDADLAPKLLKSSKGQWDELLSHQQKNPERHMLGLCFAYRKQIRKGLFDASRCKVFPLEDNRWRWELWAVHPYGTPYPWQD